MGKKNLTKTVVEALLLPEKKGKQVLDLLTREWILALRGFSSAPLRAN